MNKDKIKNIILNSNLDRIHEIHFRTDAVELKLNNISLELILFNKSFMVLKDRYIWIELELTEDELNYLTLKYG